MSEGATGLVVLGVIIIISAFIWHFIVKKFAIAVIGATITSVLLFQVAAYLHAGYIDPFAVIAMLTSGFISLAASLLIGTGVRYFRR